MNITAHPDGCLVLDRVWSGKSIAILIANSNLPFRDSARA